MYAAYKLDGYELVTATLCLAYQLRALDWDVVQKEGDGAWGVQGRLLAWGSVHMQPAGLQTPPVTDNAPRWYQSSKQWWHDSTVEFRTMWQTVHAASTQYSQLFRQH